MERFLKTFTFLSNEDITRIIIDHKVCVVICLVNAFITLNYKYTNIV